tara:strand:- start:24256 stop:25191 length:936 start_codon:yes stop_codon:yes gene_type:complete
MIFRFFNVLLFLGVCCLSTAQGKKMCITVDDLPTVTYGMDEPDFQRELAQGLVDVFVRHHIPAIGYVNESKLYENGTLVPERTQLLEMWLKNGLELGNHTYSHHNYHEVSFDTYTQDILQGEKVIKRLAKQYNSDIRYFRHPYLRSGKTRSQTDSLKIFLKQHNYIPAPVTIDNEDYLFAKAYGTAHKRGDKTLMDSIGKAYVDYMERKLVFYERLSQELFARPMDQTLLIHASLLNAHFLEDLVNMYLEHGYSFVSQTAILEDPAYTEKESKFGDWGISWIDRWALSKGKTGTFFKGDPETPAFVMELNR